MGRYNSGLSDQRLVGQLLLAFPRLDLESMMSRTLVKTVPAIALLIAAAAWWTAPGIAGQASPTPSTKSGDWTHYTADVRGSRYSPLDQITPANFSKLEVAWRFK